MSERKDYWSAFYLSALLHFMMFAQLQTSISVERPDFLQEEEKLLLQL